MRQLVRAVTMITMASVFLAGCGAATRPAGIEAESKLELQADNPLHLQCESGKEHWRAPGPAVRGGVFKYSNNPSNLSLVDPGGRFYNAYYVYERLLQPRGCYYEDTVLGPGLAASWEMAPDGLTWTFQLRKDVRWQNIPPVNGRGFTAADVGWSIEYQKRGGAVRTFWQGVEHEEPDPHTVILTFKAPDPDFLLKIVEEHNVIVPPELAQQPGGYKTAAVGTGPFMVKDFKPGHLVVERNPTHYRMGGDGKSLPYMDGAEVINVPDYSADLAAMRAGFLDDTAISYREHDAQQLRQTTKLQYVPRVGATIFGLFPSTARKPFDDVRVRRALSLAIDRDEVINGSLQGGAVYSGFIPSPLREYAWPVAKTKERFRADPDRAKAILVEAGYRPGDIQFVMQTVAKYAQEAEVVEQNLKRVGITAQIEVEGAVTSTQVLLAKGGFDAVWGAATPPFLVDYFVNAAVRTGGSANWTGFNDPKVDALADQQAREVDPAKRKGLIDEQLELLYQGMPYIPVYNLSYNRFYSCRVKSLRPPDSTGGGSGLEEAWLDGEGC